MQFSEIDATQFYVEQTLSVPVLDGNLCIVMACLRYSYKGAVDLVIHKHGKLNLSWEKKDK